MEILNLGVSSVEIHLQPIVWVNKKKVFGYEALVRAYEGDSYIAPEVLFAQAKKHRLCLDLDKYLRVLAIEKFQKYFLQDKKSLLFLNFESSSINENFQLEQSVFEEKLEELAIPTKNIVIEIKEDSIKSTEVLSLFTDYYKKKGFIIAIDDFGTGSSQYERLAIVKPDIVKIDRSLLTNVDDNFIHAEIVKSIANMCYKIGATPLAEGVEQESEILKCLSFDIQVYQGYFFAKPQKEFDDSREILQKCETIRSLHKKQLQEIIDSNRNLFLDSAHIIKKVLNTLTEVTLLNNQTMVEMLKKEKKVEALYAIDMTNSKQIGDTLFLGQEKGFYEASKDGEDHSLKEYFYICKNSKHGEYVSKRYISSASGNLCKTYSRKITFKQKEYILCLDLNYDVL